MDLKTWLSRAENTKYGLAKASGLSWRTIHRIADKGTSPQAETAMAIERATGGEVTAAELLGLVPADGEAA